VIFESVSPYFVVYEYSFIVCDFGRDIRAANASLLFMTILVICD
jgi:hypothetical protein